MGKKVKKKARSGHKDKRVSTDSPKAAVPHKNNAVSNIEATDNGTPVVHNKRACPHVGKGVNLEKLSAKLKSSELPKCEDCREAGGRGGKGKAKHGKKKGGADPTSESKAIWVCLDCGNFSCGGVGLPTTPHTHATRHARLDRHPLAVQFGNPQLQWCFPCSMPIRAEKSEDGVEQKDVLHEVVKIMKVRPREGPALDAEDVWFGSRSGNVKSAVVLENCPAVSSGGRGCYSVKGLVNLGNTCFFNSVMQNLLALNQLREYFFKLDGSLGPLTAALKKLVAETNPESGLRNAINPRAIFGSICAKAPQFRGFQQQDSHELLRYLLDGLSTEELSARKQDKSLQEIGNPDPIFVDAIFGGKLSSTVTCLKCGHSSLVYEPFLDLSLSVPTKKPPSKRAQQIARANKHKPPPRRNARTQPKILRDTSTLASPSTSNASASEKSSCRVQSIVPVPEKIVHSSGDYTSLVCTDSSVLADNESFQTDSILSSAQHSESSQVLESVVENSTPTDCFSWLDVLGADGNDYFSTDDLVENHGSAENPVQIEIPPENSFECSGENVSTRKDAAYCSYKGTYDNEQEKLMNSQAMDLQVNENGTGDRDAMRCEADNGIESCRFSCSRDPNLGVDSSGKFLEEETPLLAQASETPLLAQASEVLLLPYKEDTVATSEIPKIEAEFSSSALGYEQDSLEFDGFGDLFNEPEVASPSLKPSTSDNASEGNQVVQAGFGGNSSDSEPDEVDNAHSPVSVESCLSYFTKPEVLFKKEHAWQCENCSKVLQERKMKLKKKLQNPGSEHVVNRDVNTSTTSGLSCLHCLHKNQLPSSDGRHLCNGDVMYEKVDTADGSFLSYDRKIKDEMNCLLENGERTNANPVPSTLKDLECASEVAIVCSPESSSRDDTFSKLDNKYKNDEGRQVDDRSFDGCAYGNVEKEEVFTENGRSESEMDEAGNENQGTVKVERDATKRILISRAPSILTIHLKRFSQDARGRLSKLSGFVQFNHTIDLKPYMDTRCAKRDNYKYHLVGAVEHMGTMRGGHYVAYVRGGMKSPPNGENKAGSYTWYHASDAYVREASLEEVLRSEAYILFYERI